MACPFFVPTVPADWMGAYPRLPLGEAWKGNCAASGLAFEPQGALLFEVCNTGQGRRRCPHFPENSGSDAVRFHVLDDHAESLVIQYVFENECWPAGDGKVRFAIALGTLDPVPGDARLQAQIDAFARSYLSRRSANSSPPCACT